MLLTIVLGDFLGPVIRVVRNGGRGSEGRIPEIVNTCVGQDARSLLVTERMSNRIDQEQVREIDHVEPATRLLFSRHTLLNCVGVARQAFGKNFVAVRRDQDHIFNPHTDFLLRL